MTEYRPVDESILNDPRLTGDEITAAGRARKDIAQIFEQYGMPTIIPDRPGVGNPQLVIESMHLKLWPKILVTRRKFTPLDKLAEATAFSRFAGQGHIPIVVHKRPADPFTITMYLEDFAPIFQLADTLAYHQNKEPEGDDEQPTEGVPR